MGFVTSTVGSGNRLDWTGRPRPFPRRAGPTPARVGLALALLAGALDAQIRPPGQVPVLPPNLRARATTGRDAPRGMNPYSAVIQPSEEATTLLRRASEGIERQDWKLAIDSLQRIVELPGEHVLTSDGQRYESARQHAHRRIAALPPAGLRAYRLVHDGEAAALFQRGVEAHDSQLLQVVVDRFLCTSIGDRAAFTLADWFIDAGRFSEAAGLLQLTFGVNGQGGLYPDSQLTRWAVPARLAVCAAALGQRQRAESLVSVAASQPSSAPASRPEVRGDKPSPAELDPERIRARLSAVRKHVAAAPALAAGGCVDDPTAGGWLCAMGNWARDGQQPAVSPALVDHDAWKVPLSLDPVDSEAIQGYAQRHALLPVRQVLTDGRVLVVRRENALLGLDIDSFSPIWESRKRAPEATPASADDFQRITAQNVRPPGDSRAQVDARMRADPVVIRTLHDSVGGGLSLARGMALAVEWVGDAPQPLPENMGRRIGGFPGRDPFTVTHANRIVAYSLRDGSFLWKSDASATRQINIAGSGPAETEFLASPVYAEGYLVAPCRMNSDLYAILLDPQTGRLVRQIYLCGTGGGAFDSLAALDPCVADGMVFFPTGRELLVAVETVNWSVRWAVRYEGMRNNQPAAGWLPGPAVAVSDVVLLAPTDCDALLCFDRSSGALRWKAERDTFNHIIAASDKGVWIGGKGVAMLDIESGRPVWRQSTPDASGRGCLSADRLYVSTFEGIRTLSAGDGKPVVLDAPPEPRVLGNLLAWEGSLYSAGMSHLERFPDLGKGYEQALARHREDPTDASRALRLASLERLRNDPLRAIAALAGVPEGLKDTNPMQHQSVIHLRVRSMLEAVSSGKVEGERALELLRQARSIALSETDALASVDELGKYLTRNNRPFEAAMQYLTLVVSPEGDLMVAAEGGQIVEARKGEGFQRRARAMAVERIVDSLKELSAQESAQLREQMASFLAQAAGKRDSAALVWLAESPDLGDVAHQAQVLLGTWAAAELRFEQAESYFRRALRGSKERDTLGEAAARLAAMYLEPDEFHQPVSAMEWLNRLSSEWGDVLLPGSILDPAGERSTQPAGQTQSPVSGRDAAQALEGRLNREKLKAHLAAMVPTPLGRPEKPSFRMHPMSRPLCFRGPRTEPLADQILLFLEGNKVQAHAAKSGEVPWPMPVELRLLGDLAVEPRTELTGNLPSARSDALGRARGVLSGQTMIVNTEYGLHAIGLLTGRRLWSRPFEPPEGSVDRAASDACLWTHDGYVVSVNGRSEIEVAYACQGDRILWLSSMPQRKWAAIRARGEFLVAVDAGLEVADIFRLADGRSVGECRFEQDVAPHRQVNVTLFDDVICGPAAVNEVKAIELAAPGVERWRVTMPAAIAQIFKPSPDLLAVADRMGLLRLIDPSSGRQLMETRVRSCGQGVSDGAIIDGTLYVYGYQFRATEQAELDKQRFAMAAIGVADGQALWEMRDLGARTFLSEELLRASTNAIPVVSFEAATPRPQQPPGLPDAGGAGGAVQLVLISRKTGKPMGEPLVTTMERDPGASRIQNVEVWPGQILVMAGSTHLRYPVEGLMAGADGEMRRLAMHRGLRLKGEAQGDSSTGGSGPVETFSGREGPQQSLDAAAGGLR